MTIIAYLFITFVTFTFLSKLLSSSEVEVSVSESFTGTFPKINLFENNFYPVIGISSETGLIESADFSKYLLVIGTVIKTSFTSIAI
jgi:hypothetical protein